MKREPFLYLPVRVVNDERMTALLQNYGTKGLGVLTYAMLQFNKMHGSAMNIKELIAMMHGLNCTHKTMHKIIEESGFFAINEKGMITEVITAEPHTCAHAAQHATQHATSYAVDARPVPSSSNNINSNMIINSSASASPTTSGISSPSRGSEGVNSEEQQFLAWLSGLSNVCAMQHSITFAEFLSLIALGHTQQQVMDKLVRLNNMRNAPKRYLSAYQTVKEWLQTSAPIR